MNSEKPKDEPYKLFIKLNLISKPKKYYLFFKPKDIIIAEHYEFNFSIKNVGDKSFPGGIIENPDIHYSGVPNEQPTDHLDDICIPEISKDETYTTKIAKRLAVSSGIAYFRLKIKPSDNKQVKYYQLERATNEKQLLDGAVWEDYFYVASQQDIHQRYTNYILLVLTTVTAILLIINLVLLLG